MPTVKVATCLQIGSLSLAAGALLLVLSGGSAMRGAPTGHTTNTSVPALATNDHSVTPARPLDASPEAPSVNTATTQERMASQLDALQTSLARLLANVEMQDERIDALVLSADSMPAADGTLPIDDNADELGQVDAQDRSDELFDSIENNLLEQGDDPKWSRQAERDIEIGIASVIGPQHGELSSVECRSSLCRLETVHSDRLALDNFMQVIPDAIGWDHSGLVRVEHDADGTTVAILLINREGHDPIPAH